MSHFYQDLLLNAQISINIEHQTIDVRCRKKDLPKFFVDLLTRYIERSFTVINPDKIHFSWHNPIDIAQGFLVTVHGFHGLTENDYIDILAQSSKHVSDGEKHLWDFGSRYTWNPRVHNILPKLQAKIEADNFIKCLLLLSCYHDVGKKLPLDIWVKITGYFNSSISGAELKSIVRKERETIRQSARLNVEFGLFKSNVHFCNRLQESFLENNRHRSPQHQHEYDKRFGLIPYNK